MKKSSLIIIVFVLVVLIVGSALLYQQMQKNPQNPASNTLTTKSAFETDLHDGVLTKMTSLKGKAFYLKNFQENSTIVSGQVISGYAEGWSFEGSFRVDLVDPTGHVLVDYIASSEDWKEGYLPFTVELNNLPAQSDGTKYGYLDFVKVNPSVLLNTTTQRKSK